MTRAVVLFGHGSRDPQWREAMDAVAARVAALDASLLVRCAFLEMMQPDLPACLRDLDQAGATHVSVLPLFLGTGRHARHDLPVLVDEARVSHPHIEIRLLPSAGEHAAVLDLLARVAIGSSV
ncbi:sirohydrochlorin chelatase [Caenimonas koreensis]|uniref:sirohydrochlorin chelatase n=1 Tax=Caenimonas koreensis TaxID=367474 RepID=UPI0037850DFE